MKKDFDKRLNEAIKVASKHQMELMQYPGVLSIGVGPKRKKESFIERFPSYPLPNNEPDKAFLDNLYSQALLGNRKAQFQLAQYLQQGVGTDKDITNAKLWYEKSARQNYLEAQYQLGLLLLIDLDNPKEGLYWLEQSAFKGNQHAQFALALLYQQGFKGKVEKDDKRSLAMYHLSASGNYAPAKFNLAQLYVLNGFNDQNLQKKRAHHQMLKHLYEDAVKANIEDAKLPLALYYANKKSAHEKQVFAYQTIKQAAIDGNAKAQVLLGMLLERGIGTKPDIAKAIRYYEKSATADNRVAQFILGTYYYQGLWLKKDDAKAISLLNAAGKQGLPYAYYNLAVIRSNQHQDFLTPLKEAAQHGYAKASLFLSDYYLLNDADLNKLQIATKTYHHLAELGYPKANLKLGYMYQQGLIVKKDEKKAAAFYKKAANENNLIAMYLLANIYLSGEVGKPNIKKAKLWYQKAANLGFVPAYVALGFIAENIDYNYAGAIYWYKKAADKNSAVGSRNLALMYRYGKGIKPNNEKAMYWHNKATKENKDLLIKQAAKDRD
jgi:enhanced entry protein EnhC